MSSYPPHVIVLIGATASGKTDLAIEIAEHFKTRIHNIDSRQIYKSMNIGTAKPSENQQKKIKHFLIDIEEPINRMNVKQFQELILFYHLQLAQLKLLHEVDMKTYEFMKKKILAI